MQTTWVWFPVEVIPTYLPICLCCKANSAFLPSKVGKWVLNNNGSDSEWSTIKVASITHHWPYDLWLSTYDPGLVGCTQVDSFNRTSVQMCTVNWAWEHTIITSTKTGLWSGLEICHFLVDSIVLKYRSFVHFCGLGGHKVGHYLWL